MYENGVIARAAQGGDLLSVVFYPPLVVSEDDLERGVAAVADALGSALG
jgi:adenosylmethionine-8-amino-7-oxononanoate aminotransferase